MADATEDTAPPKKKKGFVKLMLFIVLPVLLLVGGGIGGTLYAMQSGWIGGGHKEGNAPDPNAPQLVSKDQQKRVSLDGKEGEGGHGGTQTPLGKGGDKYASNYYAMDKEFTSNLQDSVHFIQVGLAVSTPYDDRVLENLKTHEIAVRSAILMALGETSEDQVFTAEGKRQIQARLAKAINTVLEQKEGFGGISNVYFTNFIVQ